MADTVTPEGYYVMQYPGEQIDTAVSYVLNGEFIIPSSTSGSVKKFRIVVNDSGELSAQEVV